MNDIVLSARELAFGYSPGHLLFSDLNLDLRSEEVVAVTGPSGRGKSSLMYLLGLMLRPSGGHVVVGGQDASSRSDRERAVLRANRFGFVFQDAALDATRTVMDNVLESSLYRAPVARDELRSRARSLLEQFGVAVRAGARPGQVSGGQAQRIALCRALLHSPEVVLADEPTGNLDPDSTKTVLAALIDHSRQRGAGVLVVTHDPSVAASCDRVIAL